ncbi:MAG: SAM hydrolase/SAM-dependent halogenase family protein [Anaerolineae bacterium]
MRPIVLLTDFGTSDGYVAAMKGVVLSLLPGALLVDGAHDIPAGSVSAAAYALYSYLGVYPADTVHLVVVDPGVGTARRGIVARVGQQWFVGPDNGLLSLVWDGGEVFELDRPEHWRMPLSATFHGRDVFAPVAAKLAAGVPPDRLGTRTTEPPVVTTTLGATPGADEASLRARVIHVDRFGNLITSARASDLPDSFIVQAGPATIVGPSRTYADVQPGETLAYVGSTGLLEVAVREGNASARLGLSEGDGIEIRKRRRGNPRLSEDNAWPSW